MHKSELPLTLGLCAISMVVAYFNPIVGAIVFIFLLGGR
jgi:hypothetical protein